MILFDNFKNGQNLVLFLEISITKISSAVTSFLIWRFLFIFTISSFIRCFFRNCVYTILCLSIISENENIKKKYKTLLFILKSVAAIYLPSHETPNSTSICIIWTFDNFSICARIPTIIHRILRFAMVTLQCIY